MKSVKNTIIALLIALLISFGNNTRAQSINIEQINGNNLGPFSSQGFTIINSESELETLLQLAEFNRQENNYEEALLLLTQAINASTSLGVDTYQKQIVNAFANIYYQTEQFEQAGRYFSELVALDEEEGDKAALAVSLFNLAHVNASQENFTLAEQNFQRSLNISLQMQDDLGAAFTLKALGVNAQVLGDFVGAKEYFNQALEGFQYVLKSDQMGIVYRHLGDLLSEQGFYQEAIAHYEQALPNLVSLPSSQALQRTYRGLSSAYEYLHDYQNAFVTYRAYSQLLIEEQIQQSKEMTQRLQVQFETQQFAEANDRLEQEGLLLQRELKYQDDILKMQYLVLLLVIGIALNLAYFWWKSREHGKRMLKLATTDDLTGLLNRRAIMSKGEDEWKRVIRFKRPLSCLLFDIDFFKIVNDTWGHAAGDEVLKEVSAVISKTLRQSDILGRIGGEEFLLFSIETTPEQAELMAERVRALVESIAHPAMSGESVTISIGLAHLSDEDSLEILIQNADKALYKAKEQGRNQVVEYSPLLADESSEESSEENNTSSVPQINLQTGLSTT